MTLYLVASIASGQTTACLTDCVDTEYAATSKGIDGADVYVVPVTATRLFRKSVTPSLAEVSTDPAKAGAAIPAPIKR